MQALAVPPGTRFGRWTVLREGRRRGRYHRRFWCHCDCGTERLVPYSNLLSGASRSCSCTSFKHGQAEKTPEYYIWRSMKARCYNLNAKGYKNYGGRGITVCERWLHSFVNFFLDMGRRPTAKHSLERRNNALGYTPANCYWATPLEQQSNKRNNRRYTYQGVTLHLAEWVRQSGLSGNTIHARLNRGWPFDQAITVPARITRRTRIHQV